MKRCGILVFGVACFASSAMAESQSFEQALAAAYMRDPGLKAQQAKLRATDEQVSQALSNWRPSIDATGEIGANKLRTDNSPFFPDSATLHPKSADVSITQPIFRGFRTQGSVRSAEASVQAGRAALQGAEQQLLLDAARAYLDVVEGQDIVASNRSIEKDLERERDITRERLKIGDLKKTDVDQAQSRLDVARVARLQAEGDLTAKRTTYARLIGESSGTLTAPDIKADLPASEAEAMEKAEARNPNVIAAKFNDKAAHHDVTVAEGSLMPELSLVGDASSATDQNVTIPQRQDSFSLIAKLTVPLYRSGADYSKTRAAKQTAYQRSFEMTDAIMKAREQASNAWQALATAREVIEGSQSALAATDRALYGVKQEIMGGTRTTLDMLNAEQELLNAKISHVKAQHDEKLAILQLKASVGELTADAMQLPVELYDPTIHYDMVRDKWFGIGGEQ